MKDFLTLAHERFSVRKFSDRPVEEEKIGKIVEAGLCAPTACNYQPFKIWVLRSPEAVAAFNETTAYGFGAKVVFVVGGDDTKAWRRYKYDNRDFVDVDAAIAATQMMLEIHDLGLGSTWVGSFDQEKLKKLCPAMEGFELIAAFPVGYPAEDVKPSPSHTNKRAREEMVQEL